MSDTENPYASPQTESIPENKLINQSMLTDTMIVYLREASPWLRFIGILGYISCGLIMLTGVAAIIGMGALSNFWESIPELDGLSSIFNAVFNAVFSVSMGFYFLISAILLFFPSRFIYNFGARLQTYVHSGKEQELELALKNNKSLWKFLGILLIINLATIPVMIILGIIIAVITTLI